MPTGKPQMVANGAGAKKHKSDNCTQMSVCATMCHVMQSIFA